MNKTHPLYIDGAWVETGGYEEVTEAFSGQSLGRVAVAGEDELEAATAAAVRAFATFKKFTRQQRHQLLAAIRDLMVRDREPLADLIMRDAGKPIAQALGEVDRAIVTFELAAQETFRMGGEIIPIDIEARTAGYTCAVERFPVGPVVAITPFNFPLNLLAHKIAPALAAGATLTVKIPPQAPLTALRLAALLHEAGVPAGVVNMLHMPVPLAEEMVKDGRYKLLSFTGSAKVGWHLKSIAGKKRILLELGGNAGVLVHDDADLDRAVQRINFGSFAYAGQVCIKVQRCLVQRNVYDKFLAKFVAAAQATKAGDPQDRDTVAGPIIDRASFDRILGWITEAKAAGAKVLVGGEGKYPIIQPTLLETEATDLKVACHEIFGPVTIIAPYDTWEEGIAKLNDSAYGLQAGIFTYDVRRIRQAFEKLEVGGVIVNDVPTIRVDNYPYGGVKDSGLGREGVRYAIEEMTEMRALVSYNR